MGCDIHMVLQVKHDKKWNTIEEISLYRNYELFGILAEVRDNTHKPISHAKGLPKDVVLDKDNKINFLHLDYSGIADKLWLGEHNYSYLTAKELLKYKWNKVKEVIPSELVNLLERLQLLPKKEQENVRIVFGFDS